MDTAAAPRADPDTGSRKAGRATRVFVSYAREDAGFVDRLDASLTGRGIEVFVDRSDIEKLVAWRDRVAELIASADTLIFVLSAESAGSSSCRVELDIALSLNKRLAPVAICDVPDRDTPPELQKLNYVFCRAGDDFERSMDDLVVALETDIFWIREHTRLAELAQRWEATGRLQDGLLHGREALDAQAWLAERPRHAPEPTESHRRFVEASGAAHERRRRNEWARASAYEQAIGTMIRADAFADACRELNEAIGFLNEAEDRELHRRIPDYQRRYDELTRIAEFTESAQLVYMRSGEEEFAPALEACERGLTAIGALGTSDWWTRLPTGELTPRQSAVLRGEAHRQMLLLAGLRMMPAITRFAKRKTRSFDAGRVLRWIPAGVLRAFARAGGLDRLGLLRRLDNPLAVADIRHGLTVLDDVDAFERVEAEQLGPAFPPSHIAAMLRQLGRLLLVLASGPRGEVLHYRDILNAVTESPSPLASAALNPADYYFLGLFNFFIAKRADSPVAKIVGLFQELFPDLDARTPFATAERLLRTGVSREPENFWPHFVLGRTLLEGRDFRGAELAFNVCISIDPDYGRGFEQRALALAGQWQRQPHEELLRRAEEDSRRALALAVNDASTWWPRGELLQKLERLPEALDAYMRWMELEENILDRLSRGTGVQRAFELAQSILRSASRSTPELQAQCHALAALAHLAWSEHDAAAERSQKALAIVPTHAHARLVAAELLHLRGDPLAAIAMYEAVTAADPSIPLAKLRRAEACEKIAPGARARQAWMEVLPGTDDGSPFPAWMRSRTEAALQRLAHIQT